MNSILSLIKNRQFVGSFLLLFLSLALNGCTEEFDEQEERAKSDLNYNVEPPVENVIPSIPRANITGHIRGLALLIQFQEEGGLVQAFKSDQSAYNELFNGDKINETDFSKNFSSVKRYFYDQSGGKVLLTHEVTPILKLSGSRSKYKRVTEYVVEAFHVLKNDYPDFLESRKDLLSKTSTGDAIVGKEYSAIQALSIVIGGTSSGYQGVFTAHASNFIDLENNNSVNAVIDLGEGLYAFHYQMTPEVSPTIPTKFSEIATMSMLCHELVHSIADVRDYYDILTGGLGYHCLMSFNLYPTRPGPLNPYLKWLLGWAELKPLPSSSADLVIKPNENNTYYAYVNPKNRRELYILENRAKQSHSWSESNYSEGLGIWHIDGTKSRNVGKLSWHPTPDDHYEISFIQANIASKPKRALTWAESNTKINKGEEDDCFASSGGGLSEFSHQTIPAANWWSGVPSGMMLSNIKFDAITKDVTLRYENAFTDIPSNKMIVMSQIPKSVKEGGNSFDIAVTTTNIADGKIVRLMPPSDAWKSNVTAAVSGNKAVFNLVSPALDLSRTSTVEINKWTIITDDYHVFECKTPHKFTMEENNPPLEITITPSKNELKYGDELTLDVSVKNMLDNYGESYYRMNTSDSLYINTGGKPLHTDGVLQFTAGWKNAFYSAGTVINSVTLTYGQGVTSDGISYKPTRVKIKLTTPIKYIL